MDAKVDPTFGRAPYFEIIDTDTNAMELIENTAARQGQGAGIAAAQLVADKAVDGVLTGHVGGNALNAFRTAGIKLFVGASSQDTVKEALAKFKQDEYGELTEPAATFPCGPERGLGPGRGRGLGRGRGRCR
ncbi:NifB/NifX family molybdenum-iron cluster-binding protein [Malonomonas rubra]|nr:NifB/NifX family molybdenum-iron cluster-binding protein [Malonomonas rubra]